MAVSIRWLSSVDDLPAELWERCFALPLEGRWWYATMEKCGIDDQFEFSYGLIEQDGIAIGIAPTFVMDVPLDILAPEKLAAMVRFAGQLIRKLGYQRTLFVGSPCSDEGTVGLIPTANLSQVAGPLQTALDQRAVAVGASMIVWKDFAESDSPALSPLIQSHGLFQVASFPGTRIVLPTGGFENYLKSLTSSHRHKLKKKLKRGKEALPTISSVVQNPDAALREEIFALFWQTYLKGRTKFEKLNTKFFELIAAEPSAHFVLIRRRDTGRLAAFMLCFDCGNRAINKFIGIDYSIENAFLYFQLWEAFVDWAGRRGFTEIQSGQTGYRAKLDVGHSLVPLNNFCRCRNGLVHKIFAWQAKRISWETIDTDLKGYLASHRQIVRKSDGSAEKTTHT